MCIRDRVRGSADDCQPRFAGEQALQVAHVGPAQGQEGAAADTAVHIGRLAAEGIDGQLADGIGGLVPVSYTHLDVYKRQAFGPS